MYELKFQIVISYSNRRNGLTFLKYRETEIRKRRVQGLTTGDHNIIIEEKL